MRHAFFVLAASTFLAVVAGCACNNCCNQGHGDPAGHRQAAPPDPGGAVSYPYYTLRGPRDYLETHPQSIGP